MALDKNDIELLRQMMREEISASETRMTAKIDSSHNQLMTYIESHVETKINALADGIQATNDRLDRMEERLDEMNETLLANSLYINHEAKSKGSAHIVKLQG